jgi:hypothetical protein
MELIKKPYHVLILILDVISVGSVVSVIKNSIYMGASIVKSVISV